MNKYLLIALTILIASSRRIHKQDSGLDQCAADHCHDLEVACFGENFETEEEPSTDCAKHFMQCLAGLDITVQDPEEQEKEEAELVECLKADADADAVAQCIYDSCFQAGEGEGNRRFIKKMKRMFKK